ncbi:kinase-like protein [Pseudovirgaria hyperparasitica]|uniref:Kinase-like protein n=1 Tax=Pseudovirgaria hyperparasitica TaxID=470096 RepID=A0A6A6WFS3_9PEZI|nr:kinase-like protein [Pseudovirgaria hyperparasitica]KAF2761593.1 kinase-like protein [Pseudovirgaria hyperparasitica]
MSSYAPGYVLTGSQWNYRIVDKVSGDNTHKSLTFKAEVIPRDDAPSPPQWALIKGAAVSDAIARENLDRECGNYRLPGVAEAACFRKLYDVIDTADSEKYIALEWLDTTLAQLTYRPDMRTYTIIKTFLEAALNSCVVLEAQNHVNTDIKPANILLSSTETDTITAKIGDLGLVFPAGRRFEAQPFAMRAPEVLLCEPCTAPSQVWATAATLLSWIKPGILGAFDSPHFLLHKAWSMAKIKRLFPEWYIPTPDEVEGHSFKATVKSAARISREEPEMRAIAPLEEELRGVEMLPREIGEVLRLVLVVDPRRRPSASEVLASKEFRALETFVGV